jgi:peptidoglycan lytic transglycosylase
VHAGTVDNGRGWPDQAYKKDSGKAHTRAITALSTRASCRRRRQQSPSLHERNRCSDDGGGKAREFWRRDSCRASIRTTGTFIDWRSWPVGRDDRASETMIRPLCVAFAISCLSTSTFAETCIASRYGYSGSRTASGERMDPIGMTAAHRSRPFGSHVTVRSHANGRSVTVRINDRGPFVKGRCIDLSNGAARLLGIDGTAIVSLD